MSSHFELGAVHFYEYETDRMLNQEEFIFIKRLAKARN